VPSGGSTTTTNRREHRRQMQRRVRDPSDSIGEDRTTIGRNA